jgi:hypothetical protein
MTIFRLFAANGNRKRKIVFLGWQMIKVANGSCFSKSTHLCFFIYMKEWAETFLTKCDTKLRNSTEKKKVALLVEQRDQLHL